MICAGGGLLANPAGLASDPPQMLNIMYLYYHTKTDSQFILNKNLSKCLTPGG